MAEGETARVTERPAVSPEARELVRGELVWLARRLMRENGLNANEARGVLRELLDLSV